MQTVSDSFIIKREDDLPTLLDMIVRKWDADWWDTFYTEKRRPVPFFRCIPDESLYEYVQEGIFRPGRVIDIGCGNGRNAIYLAKSGFSVDALDFSQASINWAKENAEKEQVKVNFICDSVFHYSGPSEGYDYIYDSGCLHHIKPHRRVQYLKIISDLLKQGGYFGLSCFNTKGGADISDGDVYRDGSMHGGMGYSAYKLRFVLEEFFEIMQMREMREIKGDDLFGIDTLWVVLMKKKGSSGSDITRLPDPGRP